MNLENLELGILFPAFLAGLLVLATHVPLGQQVLNRGIVFIDLAIAQVAGLGVTAAASFGSEPLGWQVQAAAVGAALLGALVLTWTEKVWPEVQEALIGVLFVVAACVELLLLANNPHGGEHLKDLLVGQILWVNPRQLGAVAVLTLVLLAIWIMFGTKLGRIGFYAVFAFAVTASVQLVGVYLVFASLIIPALATRAVAGRRRQWIAYGTGVIAYAVGLAVSAVADLPSGAVVVMTMAVLGIACAAAFASRGARVTRS